jgi:hypothetical protein
MPSSLAAEIAVQAAQWVVDEGMDYGHAKRKAAKALDDGSGRAMRDLPSNEQVEDEVRAHIALFHADTQPTELNALRDVALRWMRTLAQHQPHLVGAVWRGTATRQTCVRIELYAQDPKLAQIDLLNLGIHDHVPTPGGSDSIIMTREEFNRTLQAPVTIDFEVLDADALRGALKPDARGQTWRGDLAALQRLLQTNPTAGSTDLHGRPT